MQWKLIEEFVSSGISSSNSSFKTFSALWKMEYRGQAGGPIKNLYFVHEKIEF